MSQRITNLQKEQILAGYAELGSYRAAARRTGVSAKTVKRIVQATGGALPPKPVFDMTALLTERQERVGVIIDAYLERLLEPELLDRANPSQLASVIRTLIEEFTLPERSDETEQEERHRALLDAIRTRHEPDTIQRKTASDS